MEYGSTIKIESETAETLIERKKIKKRIRYKSSWDIVITFYATIFRKNLSTVKFLSFFRGLK